MTFNRPESRNAINNQMGEELAAVVAWLEDNEDVRVVVVRGAGGHFCSGGDIKERRNMADEDTGDGHDPIMERNRTAGLAFHRFENLSQTTIAMVEGSAFGGGMGYACLTDITIIAKGARMGMPETTLGVAPAQIAPYVVKRIGLTRARQLALTAERFDGTTAYEYGVGQYLCDDADADRVLDEVVRPPSPKNANLPGRAEVPGTNAPDYSPRKAVGRFSRKAFTPSLPSKVSRTTELTSSSRRNRAAKSSATPSSGCCR